MDLINGPRRLSTHFTTTLLFLTPTVLTIIRIDLWPFEGSFLTNDCGGLYFFDVFNLDGMAVQLCSGARKQEGACILEDDAMGSATFLTSSAFVNSQL
jgi:hypothetical protein